MVSARELSERIASFDLIDAINQAVAKNADEVEKIIREQMYQGLNGYDSEIGRYRNLAYAEEKYDQNSAAGFGNVDLRLTGSFYAGIEVYATGQSVVITSTDSKTSELTRKYGDAIFKLGTEAKQKFMALIREDVLEYFKDHLGIL